jgi:hypothetical protein
MPHAELAAARGAVAERGEERVIAGPVEDLAQGRDGDPEDERGADAVDARQRQILEREEQRAENQRPPPAEHRHDREHQRAQRETQAEDAGESEEDFGRRQARAQEERTDEGAGDAEAELMQRVVRGEAVDVGVGEEGHWGEDRRFTGRSGRSPLTLPLLRQRLRSGPLPLPQGERENSCAMFGVTTDD